MSELEGRELEGRAKRLGCYLQGQCHSEGSCNQNMTFYHSY